MNIVTRGYDNARSMVNPAETILTAAAVAKQGIRRIFSLPFEGDARGMEAQPLLVNGLVFPDGRTHNVMYSATMTNQIWAHDADNSQLLWEITLANAIDGTRGMDMYLINDHWGILSTPVIDTESNTLYCVTWGCADALDKDGVYLVHAIDLLTGAEKKTPLSLEGASYAAAGKTSIFKSVVRKQRASLLMTDVDGRKTVFIGAGSLLESMSTNQGWVIAVDVGSWKVSAAWTSTSKGSGGGIWMAGAGLAADSEGFVYAMTGNGDFDGVTDFGESFVKLEYTGSQLLVRDWFSPFLDDDRNGREDAEHDVGVPTNARGVHAAAKAGTLVEGMAMNAWGDMDLGAGGLTLVPSLGLVCGAGKDGILYALKMDDLGKTSLADLAAAGNAGNYAKLAFPPIFFTYYQPGNPAPVGPVALAHNLNQLYGGVSHHQHGEMIHWKSAMHGDMLFCWGENGNLRAWALTATTIEYLACSAEVASVFDEGVPGGGMPGGMITLAANGSQNGIIVASIPYGNANQIVSPGRLLIYDAQNFTTNADGSKALRVIWDSQDWNITFSHNKFNRPVVANGKLYCPTYDGRTDVYALA